MLTSTVPEAVIAPPNPEKPPSSTSTDIASAPSSHPAHSYVTTPSASFSAATLASTTTLLSSTPVPSIKDNLASVAPSDTTPFSTVTVTTSRGSILKPVDASTPRSASSASGSPTLANPSKRFHPSDDAPMGPLIRLMKGAWLCRRTNTRIVATPVAFVPRSQPSVTFATQSNGSSRTEALISTAPEYCGEAANHRSASNKFKCALVPRNVCEGSCVRSPSSTSIDGGGATSSERPPASRGTTSNTIVRTSSSASWTAKAWGLPFLCEEWPFVRPPSRR